MHVHVQAEIAAKKARKYTGQRIVFLVADNPASQLALQVWDSHLIASSQFLWMLKHLHKHTHAHACRRTSTHVKQKQAHTHIRVTHVRAHLHTCVLLKSTHARAPRAPAAALQLAQSLFKPGKDFVMFMTVVPNSMAVPAGKALMAKYMEAARTTCVEAVAEVKVSQGGGYLRARA